MNETKIKLKNYENAQMGEKNHQSNYIESVFYKSNLDDSERVQSNKTSNLLLQFVVYFMAISAKLKEWQPSQMWSFCPGHPAFEKYFKYLKQIVLILIILIMIIFYL